MVKIYSYRNRKDINTEVRYKQLWYDVGSQVFYDKDDKVFGVGIVRNGVAVLE